MLFLKDSLKTRKLQDLVQPELLEEIQFDTPECVKIDGGALTFASPLEIRPSDDPEDKSSITGIQIENVRTVSTENTFFHKTNKGKRCLKRKRYFSEDSFEDQDCDDMFFFKSLLPFVKRLTEDQKLMFRMNVQQMLYNELYRQEN